MSSTPIAISAHSRRMPSLGGAAFAPWLLYNKSAPCPPRTSNEEPAAQMHMSPTSFNFHVGSPNAGDVSASLRAKGFYDPAVIEQEHCTGYECCDLKLGDMHAVIDHYENAHCHSRMLGHIQHPPVLPPRTQVFRQQTIVTPVLLPVLPIVPPQPQFQQRQPSISSRQGSVSDDAYASSAPSPCPSSTTSRGSVSDGDTEFPVDLDRLPRTPPAHAHADANVTIVGEYQSPDGHGSGFANYNPFGQPITATAQSQSQGAAYGQQQKQPVVRSGSLFPVVQVAAPPQPQVHSQGNFPSYGASQVAQNQNHSEVTRPVIHVQVSTPSGTLTDAADFYTPDTPSFGGDSVYTPSTATPSPITPHLQWPQQSQQHLQPPTQMRQPAAPSVSVANQHHSFHHPQPQQPFNVHCQLESQSYTPSPKMAPIQQQHQQRPELYAVRKTDSLASTSAAFASGLQLGADQTASSYFAAATAMKRSYDEMAEDSFADDHDEDEDDEDADGEVEVLAHYPAPTATSINAANTTPAKKATSGQPKEKKQKTGRPRNGTRASAQKDPKRAKLFCPREGCTKRYMNPNGLKYHLEKGTCTFE